MNKYLSKVKDSVSDEATAAQGSNILGKYYTKMKQNRTKTMPRVREPLLLHSAL